MAGQKTSAAKKSTSVVRSDKNEFSSASQIFAVSVSKHLTLFISEVSAFQKALHWMVIFNQEKTNQKIIIGQTLKLSKNGSSQSGS